VSTSVTPRQRIVRIYRGLTPAHAYPLATRKVLRILKAPEEQLQGGLPLLGCLILAFGDGAPNAFHEFRTDLSDWNRRIARGGLFADIVGPDNRWILSQPMLQSA
jgi:hypothetical protein